MPELICHLVGDFILQNHAMAANKVKSWAWAALHVALYMLPFLLLTRAPLALVVMAGTHLVIDRFRLAKYWVAFWGVGCEGWVAMALRLERWENADMADPGSVPAIFPKDDGPAPAPDFLAVWLLILVDNTAHLAINHLALVYLG